jgi:hypothetical protein
MPTRATTDIRPSHFFVFRPGTDRGAAVISVALWRVAGRDFRWMQALFGFLPNAHQLHPTSIGFDQMFPTK